MRTAIICMVAVLGSMGLAAGRDVIKSGVCSDGYHECLYNGACIPNYMVCDGSPDCPYYYDDEHGCDITTKGPCNDGQYQCMNSQCIPDRWVCDDYPDCPYGDDEDDCDTTDYTDTTDVTSCPGDYYQCQYNGECIPDYWLCDGIGDCPVYGDDEQGCTLTSTTSTTTTTTTPPPQGDCENSFDYIYDRCVLVDPFTSTTWDEARYLCEKFSSDLVVLDDYNFYAELLQYIRNKGLDSHNYWVGATDKAVEGVWLWVDSSPVPSETPLWALYGCTGDYQLEPRPSDAQSQDCGFLDGDRGLYMSDASCDASFATICQTPSSKKETKNEEVIAKDTKIGH